MDQTDLLAGQIFDPKNRFTEGRILSASDGIVKRLPIYVWPKNVGDDEKLKVIAYMTAFGTSTDESPSKWATWMYTYIVMCFSNMEELIKREGQREFEFLKFPIETISLISELSDSALSFDGSGDNTEYLQLLQRIRFPPTFPSLPHSIQSFPEELAGCKTIPAVYGFCGLIMFLAGKKINEKNVTTITERRPQNLVDTYGIPDEGAYFLTGEGKMQMTALKMCNLAWTTHANARKAIITDVAAFAAGQTLPQRVVYTISKLLENVGMQSAYYIHRFLQAFPEAKTYACIRPALGVYASSIREVARADSRVQPYYKVIHGDLTRVFHRNGILSLAACALSFEKTTSPSMRNYTLGEGATTAVNLFDAEAAARKNKTLGEFTNVTDEQVVAE